MNIGFLWFVEQLIANPIFLVTVVLTLGVIFVNGWTDAPNAIATCIATRSIRPRQAIIMSAVFNFIGTLFMTAINATVAMTIKNMVDFGDNLHDANVALCAALFAIILWAVMAWRYGIPTSESHALIAGISGAAIAINNGFDGINGNEWIKVIYGLVLSTVLGFCIGFLFTRIVMFLCRNIDKRKTTGFFKNAQVFGAAAMSFMHGAQDGQKFIGVLILGIFMVNGDTSATSAAIPFWMVIMCSFIMGLGTSLGGRKIIKAVGMDMVKLEKYQGFSADTAAAICLLISSIFGIPVSTTHTKTTAIMGVGATKRLSAINLSVVGEMVLTWILTFPGCGLIGYIITKIFILIF